MFHDQLGQGEFLLARVALRGQRQSAAAIRPKIATCAEAYPASISE
jgi:hypothetical protein